MTALPYSRHFFVVGVVTVMDRKRKDMRTESSMQYKNMVPFQIHAFTFDF